MSYENNLAKTIVQEVEKLTVKEILNVVIRGSKVFVFPLKYDSYGQFIVDSEHQKVLDMRAWGRIQYHEGGKAEEIQDGFAQWVVDTLNAEYKKL